MQFKDIVGQRVLANRLTEIVDKGRVSHAQMLVGDMGYGTLALSLAYAQYVACTNRQHYEGEGAEGLRADSCGECPNCKKFSQLVHPDLHLYFPNTQTGRVKTPCCDEFGEEFRDFLRSNQGYGTLEDWYEFSGAENKQGIYRELDVVNFERETSLKSYEGGFKIFVMWMPETMPEKVSNELLKRLEEPYENTLYLLVAENDERMLETVRSRVQAIRVGRILDGGLEEAAEGSYIRHRQLTEGDRDSMEMRQRFVSWMRLLFKLRMQELGEWVEHTTTMTREQQKGFLRFAMDMVHRCLRETLTNGALPANLQTGDEKFDKMFPGMITPNNAAAICDTLNEAMGAISLNCNEKLVWMQLSFKMSIHIKKR